jgi:hypothetical protein
LPDFRSLIGDSAPLVTSRHAQCSDRSPLHDVRHHARRRPKPKACGFEFSRTNLSAPGSKAPSGGARRDRTDDLLLAKQALSQLSYGPCRRQVAVAGIGNFEAARMPHPIADTDYQRLELVGLGRLELPTSRLSSARSNQLSYKPVPGVSNQKSVIRKPARI